LHILEHLRGEIRAIESGSQVEAQSGRASRDEVGSDLVESVDGSGFDDGFDERGHRCGTGRGSNRKAGAFEKIVALVNVRDRSERALRDRLARDGFPENEVEEAVARAKDYGFINDERYAEVLVRSRLSQGRGSAGIERELRENDIDINVVPGWPHEYPVDFEQEVARALDLLSRKPPRSKNLREGAYRKLVTKGYSSSVASTAARQWVEQSSN